MAAKHWLKTRPREAALAALAWTVLGCVFALPDLTLATTGSNAALFSYAMVVVAPGHPSDSLGGPADPRFEQATRPAGSGAFTSKPADHGRIRLFIRRPSGRVWDR